MVKYLCMIFVVLVLTTASHAEDKSPEQPLNKTRYSIGGVANGMILLIDNRDPDNSVYVQDNTILDNGCIVTKIGISCGKNSKKETQSYNVVDVPTLLEIVVSLVKTERDFPMIGKVKIAVTDKFTYMFATKEQSVLINTLFASEIKKQLSSDKLNIFVFNKSSIVSGKGE